MTPKWHRRKKRAQLFPDYRTGEAVTDTDATDATAPLPPPLPENATEYQRTVYPRLTGDLRAALLCARDVPISFSLAKDMQNLGFPAVAGESTRALALEWFGLSEPEGGEGDA